MRWQHSVGQILRTHWEAITALGGFNSYKIKHLSAISKCRTAALGGHIDACASCGFYKISYNSCGNRHCPTCGALKREQWIVRQEEKLLNVPYFHVVFTLPHQLNALCLQHPRLMYGLLFRCVKCLSVAIKPKKIVLKTWTLLLFLTVLKPKNTDFYPLENYPFFQSALLPAFFAQNYIWINP